MAQHATRENDGAVVKGSLAARWPYAKDFLAQDWGLLRIITTSRDTSAHERKIVELVFADDTSYRLYIWGAECARRCYEEVLRYLRRYHYYIHKELLNSGRIFCEIEFGSFRKTTPDLARDFMADANNNFQSATREVSARATALKWPTEKYANSPERGSRKQKNILTFLRRVWVPFIKENNVIVTRQVLEHHDPDAWRTLKSYFRSSRNTLPSDIPIMRAAELKQAVATRPISAPLYASGISAIP